MRIRRIMPWLHIPITIVTVVLLPIMIFTGSFALAGTIVVWWICSRGHDKRLTNPLPDAIVYLRPFGNNEANESYYKRVEPVLSCFGLALEVAARQRFSLYPVNVLFNWLKGTPGILGPVELDESDWRSDVINAMKKAKIILIDVSTQTPNVLWELNAAIEHKGRNAIIVLVYDERAEADIKKGFGELRFLYHSSPKLERDTAEVLQEILGTLTGIRKAALAVFLTHGMCLQYRVMMLIWEFKCTFSAGVRR